MTAIYRRVADDLRNAIRQGMITRKLPSESELAQKYGGVRRQTVRVGLRVLQDEGLIEPVHGSGWYVAGTVDRRTVEERILTTIVKHQLQPGDRLPTEGEMAHSLGVSRFRIRNALTLLEGQGLISPSTPHGRTVA